MLNSHNKHFKSRDMQVRDILFYYFWHRKSWLT